MNTSLFLLATLTTLSVARVPNIFYANDPAKSEQVNANFKHLDSAVGTKADTAALSALKASIPASVNIGGKLDTGALTTRLSGYATAGSLANYALAGTLSTYATTAALTNGLGGKVDTAKLTTRLGGYATTGAISGFATTAALNGKMATADYVESDHLKALGGITGGRGFSGRFQGSNITLDTTQLKMEAGDYSVMLSQNMLKWGNGFEQWRITADPGSKFTLSASNFVGETPVLNITASGAAQFTGDVQIDGALTLKTAAVVVPDYVFGPTYKLAPLAEVESFTQANKHLPDVPSAQEIEAGGMDLAKMNLVLLKKVEELTLHAIAQEKRIQSLETLLTK